MPDTKNQPSGTEGETLEERLKAWENEKKGLINDLREEREKRHGLESRLNEIETALTSTENNGEDIQARVNKLAQNPDEYIDTRVSQILEKTLKPLSKDIESLRTERQFEKAYQWLSKQEGKDIDDLYGSDVEKEIVQIIKDHGMTMMSPYEGTRAAYKIYKQELKEKESKEAERNEKIQKVSDERSKNPVRTGQMRFTREQIIGMSRDEYNRNREAILEAQEKGLIS